MTLNVVMAVIMRYYTERTRFYSQLCQARCDSKKVRPQLDNTMIIDEMEQYRPER